MTPLPPPPLVDASTPICEVAAAPMTPLPPPPLPNVGTRIRRRLQCKTAEALTCYSALACGDTLRRVNSETSTAMTPQSADSRSKGGGWRKCGHPLCQFASKTLQALSGSKHGFPHRLRTDVRVCGPCRTRPWPENSTVLTTSAKSLSRSQSPGLGSVARRDSDVERFAIDMETWKDDTVDKLMQLFVYTAENPRSFAWERWQFGCRVARLLDLPAGDRPFHNCREAAQCLEPVKMSRQKIARIYAVWCRADDKTLLACNPPAEFGMGRYAWGSITDLQKHDLAICCGHENV